MKNILIFGMTENPGGVEQFLINYLRRLDKETFCFSFLCNTLNKVAYEDELSSEGIKFYHISKRSENPITYYRELNSFFKKHSNSYDAIWVNVCSLANIDYLIKARQYGITKRIIHSHNNSNMDSILRGILHKINKKMIKKYATDFWACSESAAKWFFDDDLVKQVVIIKDAIDINEYQYNEDRRSKIRDQYQLNNRIVIGNVGRLHFQKNQSYLLRIFSVFKKKYPIDAKLVLIGDGPDRLMLENLAIKLGVEDDVLFPGVQKDIQGWLSAMDVFVFPSVFEGLGIALLEAQANGLAVITSDNVLNSDNHINPNVLSLKISDDTNEWVTAINSMYKMKRLPYEQIEQNFYNKAYLVSMNLEILKSKLGEI